MSETTGIILMLNVPAAAVGWMFIIAEIAGRLVRWRRYHDLWRATREEANRRTGASATAKPPTR